MRERSDIRGGFQEIGHTAGTARAPQKRGAPWDKRWPGRPRRRARPMARRATGTSTVRAIRLVRVDCQHLPPRPAAIPAHPSSPLQMSPPAPRSLASSIRAPWLWIASHPTRSHLGSFPDSPDRASRLRYSSSPCKDLALEQSSAQQYTIRHHRDEDLPSARLQASRHMARRVPIILIQTAGSLNACTRNAALRVELGRQAACIQRVRGKARIGGDRRPTHQVVKDRRKQVHLVPEQSQSLECHGLVALSNSDNNT